MSDPEDNGSYLAIRHPLVLNPTSEPLACRLASIGGKMALRSGTSTDSVGD